MNNPVQVYKAWNSRQAHFLCQLLENAGIASRVASDAIDTLSGVVPFQKLTCPIFVDAADEEQAKAILSDYENESIASEEGRETSEESNTSFCYHCGEDIEQGQTPCPACASEIDWSQEVEDDE